MKEFKTKLKYDFAEALVRVIAESADSTALIMDDDKLYVAALREVELRLKKKMVEYRPKFQLTLSPVQAIALRMLYAESVPWEMNVYTSNKLRMIADEIHQHYS